MGSSGETEMKMLNSCNEHHDCRVHFDGRWCPLCAADTELRDYERTVERLRCENTRLGGRATTTTTYRESEATREKLRINADTIRCLKATIEVHLGTIRDQRRHIEEQDPKIRELERRVDALWEDAKGTSALLGDELDNIAALETRLRERDWIIEKYRKRFATMEEKLDELTPECPDCVEGKAVCPSCGGSGAGAPRPDDAGHRFTCGRCGGSGSVKCSTCGEE